MEGLVLIPVLSILCTILALIIGFLTFNRNRDKDVKTDASESAVIKTKLDSISNGVSNIQIEIKANEKRVNDLSEKYVRIDESLKSAHKRIDAFEKKGD